MTEILNLIALNHFPFLMKIIECSLIQYFVAKIVKGLGQGTGDWGLGPGYRGLGMGDGGWGMGNGEMEMGNRKYTRSQEMTV